MAVDKHIICHKETKITIHKKKRTEKYGLRNEMPVFWNYR